MSFGDETRSSCFRWIAQTLAETKAPPSRTVGPLRAREWNELRKTASKKTLHASLVRRAERVKREVVRPESVGTGHDSWNCRMYPRRLSDFPALEHPETMLAPGMPLAAYGNAGKGQHVQAPDRLAEEAGRFESA